MQDVGGLRVRKGREILQKRSAVADVCDEVQEIKYECEPETDAGIIAVQERGDAKADARKLYLQQQKGRVQEDQLLPEYRLCFTAELRKPFFYTVMKCILVGGYLDKQVLSPPFSYICCILYCLG